MATLEKVTTYAAPGRADSPVALQGRYDNFIGGHWIPPIKGKYTRT
jgi:aldehyde dehydrogenase